MPDGHPNAEPNLLLQPGTLWHRIVQQANYALQCGALVPIPTTYDCVEQDGVRFLVRILMNLVRKDDAKKKQEQAKNASGKAFNPFLPYEEDLFVTHISDTHLCLLNKFNVVDHHILLVTRAFEEQETWLTVPDFEALWACLMEFDGLGFYNSGKLAGASQRHKHIQLVPLPLVPTGQGIPIDSLWTSVQLDPSIGIVPGLPFVHAIAQFGIDWMTLSPLDAAKVTLDSYHTLLQTVGLQASHEPDSHTSPGSYNLLVTRRWMMVIPRSQEAFASISVNSLGFAGALLVRNAEQMMHLKEIGPMTILKNVAIAKN